MHPPLQTDPGKICCSICMNVCARRRISLNVTNKDVKKISITFRELPEDMRIPVLLSSRNSCASYLTTRFEKKIKEPNTKIITEINKWCTLMDPHTWPCKSRTISTNIHSATM